MEEEVEGLLEPTGLDHTKETVSSRHNRTDTHMNSETIAACTRPVHRFKSDGGPSVKSGK